MCVFCSRFNSGACVCYTSVVCGLQGVPSGVGPWKKWEKEKLEEIYVIHLGWVREEKGWLWFAFAPELAIRPGHLICRRGGRSGDLLFGLF